MVGLRVIEKISGLLSATVVLAAGLFLWLAVFRGPPPNPAVEAVLGGPTALESFQRTGTGVASHNEARKAPLLMQAEALALHLNPPKPQTTAVSLPQPGVPPANPVVRPAVASPQFRLHATCCYPSCPEKSRALISESGAEKRRRWVKEGAQIGHFVIRQIRLGTIVCANGEQIQEVSIERSPAPRSLVRNREMGPVTARLAMETRGPVVDADAVVIDANAIVMDKDAVVIGISQGCDENLGLPRE